MLPRPTLGACSEPGGLCDEPMFGSDAAGLEFFSGWCGFYVAGIWTGWAGEEKESFLWATKGFYITWQGRSARDVTSLHGMGLRPSLKPHEEGGRYVESIDWSFMFPGKLWLLTSLIVMRHDS